MIFILEFLNRFTVPIRKVEQSVYSTAILRAILTTGVYGRILYPLLDLNEILHQSSSKPSSDRSEFELDQARSKNYIAENLFALGHDTHNSIHAVSPWNGHL